VSFLCSIEEPLLRFFFLLFFSFLPRHYTKNVYFAPAPESITEEVKVNPVKNKRSISYINCEDDRMMIQN
jgi:hypothetical protein